MPQSENNMATGSQVAQQLIYTLRTFVAEHYKDTELSEEMINDFVLALLHESPTKVLAMMDNPVQVISLFLSDLPDDTIQTIFQLAIRKFTKQIHQVDDKVLLRVRALDQKQK